MNKYHCEIDIKKSCQHYTDVLQNSLEKILQVKLEKASDVLSVDQLDQNDDLFFSILFTGQVYGEFILGINKDLALNLLNYAHGSENRNEVYKNNRDEIIDLFKEVINISVASTMKILRDSYVDITITPPKAIEGYISLPQTNKIEKRKIYFNNKSSSLSCYVYVDYMKLDIAEAMEKNKRLNKAKSEFLANMSHELRTPLNGMIGMLDLLKRSNMSHTQQEQFDVVYKSGEFLLTLISDILEFSKIESGKLEIEKRAFDLRKSIESVVQGLAVSVFNKNLKFNVLVDPKLNQLCIGDEMRVKQILMNLIGNAIKFTTEGSISVLVTLEANNHAIFRIIDTGIGISSDKIKIIFDAFSQADISDTRKFGGTGLGLTISKSLVKALRGDLEVISEMGQGSEFKVTLPIDFVETPQKSSSISYKYKSLVIFSDDHFLTNTIDVYSKAIQPNIQIQHFNYVDFDHVQLSKDNLVILKYSSLESSEIVQNLIKNKSEADILFLTEPQELESLSQYLEKRTHDISFNIMHINLPINMHALSFHLEHRFGHKTEVAPIEKMINLSHKKVLIVEDNVINQLVITTMLKKIGVEVDVSSHGLEAVQKIQSGQCYDLILMDCQMPVMDGYEATKNIREIEKLNQKNTCIVALTANAFEETRQDCYKSGMNDFATKPMTLDVLESVIKKHILRH